MTIPPRLPSILIKCEDCDWEGNCHPPENVAWSHKRHKWLCDECWGEDQEYDSERDEYINEVPMVYAKDALTDKEDMRQRMIAAAAAKRLGV